MGKTILGEGYDFFILNIKERDRQREREREREESLYFSLLYL
jgi:hypothetical protein